MNAEAYIATRKQRIDEILENNLPSTSSVPIRLHKAMRYSVLSGGKRLRPLLVYAAGESLGAPLQCLDAPAAAIEIIHSYSLVHDDLPAMDNDDLRRGMASCHKAFDDATAILAGDALQALAFEILADEKSEIPPNNRLQMLSTLTKACGSLGMAGGQSLEFDSNLKNTLDQLENIHRMKTGILIRTCVKLGALAANANETVINLLEQYAADLGLAFQIQDDIDDQANDLHSYLFYMDVSEAQKKVAKLYQQACTAIDTIASGNTAPLYWLADYMIQEIYRK